MTALGELIDDLNSQSCHVAWTSTLDSPGIYVPSHRLVVLAADRAESVLVQVVEDVLRIITPS